MKCIHMLLLSIGVFILNQDITAFGMLHVGEDIGKAAEKNASNWAHRFNMAFDMGMPMGTGMAASQASQFLSQQQEMVFADFQSQQTAITDALKAWSASQSSFITNQMNLINTYFNNQQTSIKASQSRIIATAQAEANYLFQNISLAQPPSALVSSNTAGIFDTYFATGIMATPASKYSWYNYLIAGDWLFDPETNSFWQNQAMPFPKTDPDPSQESSNVGILSANSIFVEYYPSQTPYTISGSFTLYTITYPFFAGIMFNKNRWISGNNEVQYKCRLLGIYATAENNAAIYFAEQYELSDADAQSAHDTNPIKIPLLQIINGHVKPLASIAEQTLKNSSSEPVSFNYTITTNPTSISFKIWAATDKEPTQAILIPNLNSSFYLYHTLGFMSPGVATEWKITTPKELTFSSQALKSFKNKVFPPKK